MPSQQKIASARANGAKSHGPKTEAGRKISSMNAVTHGLYAKGVVLANESCEEYQQMLDAYFQQFQPQGPAESHLLEEMVAAKWRQRRLWAIETELLEAEILTQTAKLEKEGAGYDPVTPLSLAYAALAASPLPFLNRNESRLERTYSRALKTLLQLQRLRQATPIKNLQERTQTTGNERRETRNEKPETRNQSPTAPPKRALLPRSGIGIGRKCNRRNHFYPKHDTTTLMFSAQK